MVNYFFDVDWLDNFRFQLVDKEVATDVPVLRIYHFHRMEGFRIPYSLTIIVTPDRFSMNHSKENLEASRFVLFGEKDVVYDLDLAIFVAVLHVRFNHGRLRRKVSESWIRIKRRRRGIRVEVRPSDWNSSA